jgi:hypothetical protein
LGSSLVPFIIYSSKGLHSASSCLAEESLGQRWQAGSHRGISETEDVPKPFIIPHELQAAAVGIEGGAVRKCP